MDNDKSADKPDDGSHTNWDEAGFDSDDIKIDDNRADDDDNEVDNNID